MNKIKQRVYEFGRIVNGMIITNNTYIENINRSIIPITFEDEIIGQCIINTDDNGIICDGIIYNDVVINNELSIGTVFINEHHFKDDINILDNISIVNIAK